MVDEKDLITIIKEALNSRKEHIKNYNNKIDKNLSEKMNILDDLKRDINEITKIDINELNTVVDAFSMEDEKKEELKRTLDIVKALLTLNQNQHTNYTLSKDQLNAVSVLIDNLESYIENKNKEKQNLDPEYNDIIKEMKEYKDLLTKLKSPKNNTLITNIDSILQLFQEQNIKEEEKQKILLFLIQYNQDIMKEKEKERNAKPHPLTKEKIIKVFNKYGYDFLALDQKYQEELIKNSKKGQIEDILEIWQVLGYPKFDEKKEGRNLTILLLASSDTIIKEITKKGVTKSLTTVDLKELISAFIPKSYLYQEKYPVGKMEDFKKNLVLFSEHGISIKEIASHTKDVLMLSNDKLRNNIDWLEKYGLRINSNDRNLLDDFLKALKSNHIPEMMDLWIESHPLGITYLKDNLNILTMNLSSESPIFYKLYLVEKEKKEKEAFRWTLSNGMKKLALKREITHDNIEFFGIKDKQTGKERTNSYEVNKERISHYQEIIDKNKNIEISDTIFNREFIIKMNQFIDREESLIYNIDGLRISKLKVLRIYDVLTKNNIDNIDALLFAITYQKKMTKEEYDHLVESIKNKIA